MSSPSPQLDKSSKKLNFILPKPPTDLPLSSSSGCNSETKSDTVRSISTSNRDTPPFILQPMYTLSYQALGSGLSSPQSVASTVSLQLPTPGTVTGAQEDVGSGVRHKLPLIVSQRPSTYVGPKQLSPRKEIIQQEQVVETDLDGGLIQQSCIRGEPKRDTL